jgi:hypothetical protein
MFRRTYSGDLENEREFETYSPQNRSQKYCRCLTNITEDSGHSTATANLTVYLYYLRCQYKSDTFFRIAASSLCMLNRCTV